MQKRRGGFTLIELLIVIVIIGILAAIAIPKFGKTREKAYFKAMMSDLRNLNNQQEIYYSSPASNYTYALSVGQLPEFTMSQGVTVGISGSTVQGWAATAAHLALGSTQFCGIYIGTPTATPTGLGLATPGIVVCTGE
ncbi:MAG TPA: prepilin-type N-terminal cleavage/methylation domain-containing protein [Longimicrobiales bacterium]